MHVYISTTMHPSSACICALILNHNGGAYLSEKVILSLQIYLSISCVCMNIAK